MFIVAMAGVGCNILMMVRRAGLGRAEATLACRRFRRAGQVPSRLCAFEGTAGISQARSPSTVSSLCCLSQVILGHHHGHGGSSCSHTHAHEHGHSHSHSHGKSASWGCPPGFGGTETGLRVWLLFSCWASFPARTGPPPSTSACCPANGLQAMAATPTRMARQPNGARLCRQQRMEQRRRQLRPCRQQQWI